jgi:hypothetical protein
LAGRRPACNASMPWREDRAAWLARQAGRAHTLQHTVSCSSLQRVRLEGALVEDGVGVRSEGWSLGRGLSHIEGPMGAPPMPPRREPKLCALRASRSAPVCTVERGGVSGGVDVGMGVGVSVGMGVGTGHGVWAQTVLRGAEPPRSSVATAPEAPPAPS